MDFIPRNNRRRGIDLSSGMNFFWKKSSRFEHSSNFLSKFWIKFKKMLTRIFFLNFVLKSLENIFQNLSFHSFSRREFVYRFIELLKSAR